MKKIIVLLLAFVCMLGNVSEAQLYKPKKKRKQFYGNQRLQQPLFKWVTGPNSRHGIQLQFGPTYMLTNLKNKEISTDYNSRPANLTLNPSGKIGVFAEIGMVHIAKKPRKFPTYYDWGLGYKHFGGAEKSTIDVFDGAGNLLTTEEGKGNFSNGFAFARFAGHSVIQLNPRNFIDNGIGINVDYRLVGGNKDYDGVTIPEQQFFQNNLIANLNYEFGFGFKPREGFFVIPGFRIPIFEGYEWRGGNPSHEWFSSAYMPAMFKLKLVWLFKKDPNRCPAVETNDADKKKNDAFMNGQ